MLYIEDHPINFQIMQRMVEKLWGIDLYSATTAEEGLDLLRQGMFHLVYMDLHLPGMQGVDAIRQIRADPIMSYIPIVAVTADASPATRTEVVSAGANGFITKPVDVCELKSLTEKLCA